MLQKESQIRKQCCCKHNTPFVSCCTQPAKQHSGSLCGSIPTGISPFWKKKQYLWAITLIAAKVSYNSGFKPEQATCCFVCGIMVHLFTSVSHSEWIYEKKKNKNQNQTQTPKKPKQNNTKICLEEIRLIRIPKNSDASASDSSNKWVVYIRYAQMITIMISDMPRCHNEEERKKSSKSLLPWNCLIPQPDRR